MTQQKQREWHEQWKMLQDNELFLFQEWIHPFRMEDFTGKVILECGCGGGQHTSFVAPYAREIVAVDLNTTDLAREHNRQFSNIQFIEGDIAEMDLKRKFDVVFSIGVVHHTDDPDKTVRNLARHVKTGGRLILWVYSREGNFLVAKVVEPLRKLFLRKAPGKLLLFLSKIITALLYVPIYTFYLLPFSFLPYYEYFGNFRRMSFQRNVLNVFDKLNAPQVQFITRGRAQQWAKENELMEVFSDHYKGVSWRISGIKA